MPEPEAAAPVKDAVSSVVDDFISEETSEPDTTAEETASAPAKPQPAAKTQVDAEDDEKFLTDNQGKPIPYDRFKKVVEKHKLTKSELAQLQGKYQGADKTFAEHKFLTGARDKLVKVIQQYPFLDKALGDLVERGQTNWADLFKEVERLTGKTPDQIQAQTKDEPNPLEGRLSSLEQSLAEERNHRLALGYRNQFSKELDSIKTKFSDIWDEEFQDEILEIAEGINAAKQDNEEPAPLMPIAEKIAKRLNRFKEKIYKAQTDNAPMKKKAQVEKGGGVAGTSVPKMPNVNSPEWPQWLAQHGDQLLNDE